MRLRFVMMMMLAITTPLSAQSGAGTDTCNVGAGFECQLYVLRNGRDSVERRVAKVIAVWRGALAMHNGAVDTATARANAAEYRRRSRQAEDIGRTFMGGASGSGFHELTLSRGGRSQDVGGAISTVPSWVSRDFAFRLGIRPSCS